MPAPGLEDHEAPQCSTGVPVHHIHAIQPEAMPLKLPQGSIQVLGIRKDRGLGKSENNNDQERSCRSPAARWDLTSCHCRSGIEQDGLQESGAGPGRVF